MPLRAALLLTVLTWAAFAAIMWFKPPVCRNYDGPTILIGNTKQVGC